MALPTNLFAMAQNMANNMTDADKAKLSSLDMEKMVGEVTKSVMGMMSNMGVNGDTLQKQAQDTTKPFVELARGIDLAEHDLQQMRAELTQLGYDSLSCSSAGSATQCYSVGELSDSEVDLHCVSSAVVVAVRGVVEDLDFETFSSFFS